MPRQRRKHHSRSRSRSHSHDKDRDAKRRKIELYDSPNHKRSVSPPNDPTEETIPTCDKTSMREKDEVILIDSDTEDVPSHSSITRVQDVEMKSEINSSPTTNKRAEISETCDNDTSICNKSEASDASDVIALLSDSEEDVDMGNSEVNMTPTAEKKVGNSKNQSDKAIVSRDEVPVMTNTPVSNCVQKLFQGETPTRRLTPKQLERRLESEKKRQQKEKEKEERDKQKQLEKEQKDAEKQKRKEQKQKEIEQKQKEKEEKEEQRRQEKELKLKQKEEEKMRKQQEIDEKNKEKLKEEEKKQKAAAAFVNFFVPKKINTIEEKKSEKTSLFMPFEVKCDMKLPPLRRDRLSGEEKSNLEKLVKNNQTSCSYLKDLKSNKIRSCPKTWIYTHSDDVDDEVLIVEGETFLGETICEEKPKSEKMRVKLLQFHENQRPAYYGTWRKKSKNITGRRPWGKDDIFDYEVDSDDDWEEEEQGENLDVMSDEEKENVPENEDYEVDNEFFVPHGHLSDDEVDDEENAKLSPESQKQKLKLLKDAFDQDIKSKTHKIKPRSIGCIWYNKDGDNIEEAIDRYLHPLNIITNGIIEIKKRDLGGNNDNTQRKRQSIRPLPDNLMTALAKLVHGNVKTREKLITDFLDYVQTSNMGIELSKNKVSKNISNIAKWTKNVENNTWCWIISEDTADRYKIDIVPPDVKENVENNQNEVD